MDVLQTGTIHGGRYPGFITGKPVGLGGSLGRLAPGAEPNLMSLIKQVITGQNFRLGPVGQCSQFLSASRMTPTSAASVFRVRTRLILSDRSLWKSSFRFPSRGCESSSLRQ